MSRGRDRAGYAWLLAGVLATPAWGAVLEVTRFDDPVADACRPQDCSLREAVLAANREPGRDRVQLPAGDYRIEQTGPDEDDGLVGDIDITDDLQIVGAGAALSRIDPGGMDYVFDVARGVAVSVQDVGFTRGASTPDPDRGGGIRSGAYGMGDPATTRLTLTGVLVDAFIGAERSGIDARGSLYASDVRFLRAGPSGWALRFEGSALRLDRVDFVANGRALSYTLDDGGQARITASRFTSNGTRNGCVTIQAIGAGTTSMLRSTLKDNLGSGVICLEHGAHMIVRESTFEENRDPVVKVDPGVITGGTSRLDLHQVTMINTWGTLLTLNATGSEANLEHATLIGLDLVPVFLRRDSRLRSTHSVIVGGCFGNLPLVVETWGANFETPVRRCYAKAPDNHVFADLAALGLGWLQDNGGPTETMLPRPDSPLVSLKAVDGSRCAKTDQRGYLRASSCTSGAVDPAAIDDVLLIDGLEF